MARKKPKFRIGQWVEFSAVASACYEPVGTPYNQTYRRTIERHETFLKPKLGQIVGAAYKKEGMLKARSYEENGSLYVEKTVLVWLIRDGYINKPYEVFEEDISFFGFSGGLVLPWKRASPYWTKKTRAVFSKDSKDWPRDKKGRFC